jgi:thiamine biosynthesis protein ThiI
LRSENGAGRGPRPCLIVHYGEIALKGANRPAFENRLVGNLKRALGEGGATIRREFGRLVVDLSNGGDAADLQARAARVFGVVSVDRGVRVEWEPEAMAEAARALLPRPGGRTLAVDTRRSDKRFPMTSLDVNKRMGAVLVQEGWRVDLDAPDVTLRVELASGGALLSADRLRGPGGLPVGVAGRVVSLLSGGIDSPVASWLAMKRGCEVVLAHFHNETLEHDPGKARDIARVLAGYQGPTVLYTVPFGEAQRRIIADCPSKLRMLLYRRLMARVAERLAARERARALVTGDSLGQVASQTLENLEVLDRAVSLPVLRPLLTYDKEETVQVARRIGTYDLSIQPYGDCCSFLVAKHPETRADPARVEAVERASDPEALVEACLGRARRESLP